MDSVAEDVVEADDTFRRKDDTGEDFVAGRHRAAGAGSVAACNRGDGRRAVRP